eukprot:scaffold152967_cov56-Attheya_sp.AAC.3
MARLELDCGSGLWKLGEQLLEIVPPAEVTRITLSAARCVVAEESCQFASYELVCFTPVSIERVSSTTNIVPRGLSHDK